MTVESSPPACLSRLCLAFPSGSRRTPRLSSVSWPRSGPGSSTTDSSRSTPRRCSRGRCCSPVALSTPTAGTPSPPFFEVVEPPQTRAGQRLGLRYDLTVPLARYVAEHRDTLVFPLQHYQINKVWRAERPTLGHYREFYQCDIDVIGRDELDLRHDAEIACALNHAFDKIGIEGFRIRISHRRVLAALLAAHGVHDDRTREIVLIVDEGGRQPAGQDGRGPGRGGCPAGRRPGHRRAPGMLHPRRGEANCSASTARPWMASMSSPA